MKALSHAHRRRLLDETLAALLLARKHLGPSMSFIEDCLAGHPSAVHYGDGGRDGRRWCFEHGRGHHLCVEDGSLCGGTPVEHIDPTGDAATSTDPAAEALERVDRALTAGQFVAGVLADELTAWAPASRDLQRPDPSPAGPPDGWCENHWRVDRRHEPITTRPTGEVFYRGLCRWCGDWKSAHSGILPPPEFVRLHDAGRHIAERDVVKYLARTGRQ